MSLIKVSKGRCPKELALLTLPILFVVPVRALHICVLLSISDDLSLF